MSQDYITIPLSKRSKKYKGMYETIISPEDADLETVRWSVSFFEFSDNPYAYRLDTSGEKPKSQWMSHIIIQRMGIQLEENQVVDHINRNTLDNRRENLRPAFAFQNSHNTKLNRKNTSGHKGVTWITSRKRWRSQIHVNGRYIFLGHFKADEKDKAIQAYRNAATKYLGDFVNFDEDQY